jgi:hypothetical protein
MEAVGGLRGISYVNQRLDRLSTREKYIQTGSFNLLSNQVRYGGIGIYSTFLEECHLASMNSLTLRPLGEELAHEFPGPPHGMLVHDEDAKLSLDALKEWGTLAHVAAFSDGEGKVMAMALQGGDEVDQPDHVRWAALRLLAKAKHKQSYDERSLLRSMARDIRKVKFDTFGTPANYLSQIDATLCVLEPFEQFYQGVTFLFERIRGAASDEPDAQLTDMANTVSVSEAAEAVRKSADELLRILLAAREVNATTAGEVEAVLRDSGVLSLAADVLHEQSDTPELMRIVLRRHSQVQSGKFDKGLPKAPWARLAKTGDRVSLTAQRYQLAQSQRPTLWKDVGRHPYRTGSALAFIHACSITSDN